MAKTFRVREREFGLRGVFEKQRDRDVEAAVTDHPTLWPGIKDKVTRLFDARIPPFAPSLGQEKVHLGEADVIPSSSHPHTFLPSWAPLHVSRRYCSCSQHSDDDPHISEQNRRDRRKQHFFLLFESKTHTI